MIISLIFFIQSISASFMGGGVMPDGKIDEVVGAKGAWHAPVYGTDVRVGFATDWQALQQWNNATVGAGIGYWNFGHEKLGHAITPYIYMDIPVVRLPHFELGLRPGIGAAFVTKTYRNTVSPENMYVTLSDGNPCIGSVTNLYFPEAIYLKFPIAKGWAVLLSGGWYHISNGSVRQPNSGYNIFAAELGVTKQFLAFPVGSRNVLLQDVASASCSVEESGEKARNVKKWSLTLAGTLGGRQVYHADQQSFLVGSMHVAAYWHAHPVFRLGGGVDVFYDGAYVQRKTSFVKTSLSLAQKGDCWRVGVSLQPEFVVGAFTAGLHVGAYMYDPIKELEPQWEEDGIPTERLHKPIFYAYNLLKAGAPRNPDGWLYTEVVLRYHLPWNVFVQGMMKSHLTKVEFVSLGLGFYY